MRPPGQVLLGEQPLPARTRALLPPPRQGLPQPLPPQSQLVRAQLARWWVLPQHAKAGARLHSVGHTAKT